jgi:Xaa-Pro aminopeptidase
MNYILNKENEIYYECGWSSDNAVFLSLDGHKYVITDGRYTLDAKENAKAEVIEARNLIKKARELILKHKIEKLKIDPNNWSFKDYEFLKKAVNLQNVPDMSHKKRMIKTPRELDIIKTSVKLGAEAFRDFAKKIEENLDEYELSYRFKEILTNRGKRELSFEPLVYIN